MIVSKLSCQNTVCLGPKIPENLKWNDIIKTIHDSQERIDIVRIQCLVCAVRWLLSKKGEFFISCVLWGTIIRTRPDIHDDHKFQIIYHREYS